MSGDQPKTSRQGTENREIVSGEAAAVPQIFSLKPPRRNTTPLPETPAPTHETSVTAATENRATELTDTESTGAIQIATTAASETGSSQQNASDRPAATATQGSAASPRARRPFAPVTPNFDATTPNRFATTPPRSVGSRSSEKSDISPNVSPRLLLEALVLLALSVTVFRAFVLEGFMISTSSMATALRGYHHRLTCPDCNFSFAVDAVDGRSDEDVISTDSTAPPALRECPNCRYAHVPWDARIINEGDQLLVDKQAFFWRKPRRWDTVIFRNPLRPVQVYAKRIIGLPGEVISLREGDVYVRDAIQRKTLAEQRELRILVTDSHFQPTLQDGNLRPHWQPADEQADAVWQVTPEQTHFTPLPADSAEQVHWLNYAYWTRLHGQGKTSAPLTEWPADLPLPTSDTGLDYDPVQKTISCRGTLPISTLQKLQTHSADPAFKTALQTLFTRSHQQPLTDVLFYNREASLPAEPIRDLMLELDVQPESLQSGLKIRISDGQYTFECQLDFATNQVQLIIAGQPAQLRQGTIPELPFEQPVKIEMSLFDRQVILAVNGQQTFEPYAYRSAASPTVPSRNPISLGAYGAPLKILRQRVYRDVHYHAATTPLEEGGGWQEYRLGAEEYFVLGDNSVMSVDSRHWPAGSVKQSLLIGRPVILHLPSQKATIKLGDYQAQIRIPDWERIRMLR